MADAAELIEKDCDMVIELFGGIEPARTFIIQSLHLKRHVVMANKGLLANVAGERLFFNISEDNILFALCAPVLHCSFYFNPTHLTNSSKRESRRKLSKRGSAAIQSSHGSRFSSAFSR